MQSLPYRFSQPRNLWDELADWDRYWEDATQALAAEMEMANKTRREENASLAEKTRDLVDSERSKGMIKNITIVSLAIREHLDVGSFVCLE